MENQSVSEFILLGFSVGRPSELLLGFIFLAVYIGGLGNNSFIVYIVYVDNRLRSGMYFFLGNYGILDIMFTTIISPQLIWNLLSGDKSITFGGCLAQSFFYFFLGVVEFLFLTALSYDRYAAVCHPLQYHAIMSNEVCIKMVVGCWVGAFFYIFIPSMMVARLSFCKSNIINHFFCDSGPLLNLACNDTRLIELINFVQSSVLLITCTFVTLFCYIFIISAILRIATNSGRIKVFNTCVTHLSIISVICFVSIFIYVTPSQKNTLDIRKIPSAITSILCPFLNPFIFTLKNDVVKQVMRDIMKKNTKLMAHKFWGVCKKKGQNK